MNIFFLTIHFKKKIVDYKFIKLRSTKYATTKNIGTVIINSGSEF